MVKHIQTIRRQQPVNCLGVLNHFAGLALKELMGKTSENVFLGHLGERVLIFS